KQGYRPPAGRTPPSRRRTRQEAQTGEMSWCQDNFTGSPHEAQRPVRHQENWIFLACRLPASERHSFTRASPPNRHTFYGACCPICTLAIPTRKTPREFSLARVLRSDPFMTAIHLIRMGRPCGTSALCNPLSYTQNWNSLLARGVYGRAAVARC